MNGARLIRDELSLGSAGGDKYRFAFEGPGRDPAVAEFLGFLDASLLTLRCEASPAIDPAAPAHRNVVSFLQRVAAVAEGGIGLDTRGENASRLIGKCTEYHAYLTEKCREFGATQLAGWQGGIVFTRGLDDARRVMLDVVREIILHLHDFCTIERKLTERPTASDPSACDEKPVRFIQSTDDSRRQRNYFYAGGGVAIVEMHGGYHLFVDLDDLWITPTLLTTGWWEPWIDQLLRSILSPGMTYINAGAHIGYHANLGAKLVEHFGKIFVFEASPRAFGLLRRGLMFNGFSGRTKLYEAALGAQTGEAPLYLIPGEIAGRMPPPEPRAARRPGAGNPFEDGPDHEPLAVRCVTLDGTVGPEIETADVLHMDIEGWEGPAILGGCELITRSPKLHLILEWSVDAHRDDPALQAQHRQALEFLVAQRFRFYRIVPPLGNVFATPPDLIAVDAQDLMALPHSDLFAVRQPRRA